jgi:L-amino acid N-acyltransferase YncA
MARSPVALRPARAADSRRLWEWRNEPGMRRACFNMDLIPFDVHDAWLKRALVDPARRLYVAETEAGVPVGYVRFDEIGSTAEISVCVAAERRGGGYGTALIRAGVAELAKERPDLEPVALVKLDNPMSARAFSAAGFVTVGEVEVKGIRAFDMRPSRPSRPSTSR